MKCFCSSSSLNCPANGIKECSPEIDHCLLTLKWDEKLGEFVNTIQDCWQWADRHKCPDTVGPCHIIQELKNKTKTCCCKGELCNDSNHAPFVSTPDDDTTGNETDHYSVNRIASTSVSPSSALGTPSFILLICFSTLVVLLAALFFYFFRHRFKGFLVKRHFGATRNGNQWNHLGSNHGCRPFGDVPVELQPLNGITDSFLAPGYGKECVNDLVEVDGLSSIVTKLELKSQGCFGQVWHGRITEPSDKLSGVTDVAVKVFHPAQKDSWLAEVLLFRLPDLAHPNILKYYGADQVLNARPEGTELELWIVTEYHPLSSLHDYLKRATISWNELLGIATGIARGLSHLHSETVTFSDFGPGMKRIKPSVAHRDVNSRNILLKSDLSACIADFGLAIRFEPGQSPSVAHPQLGTRRYMAPEVLDGAIQFSRDAYLRIDVYAMGLVFWELMTRCHGMDGTRLSCAASPYRAPFELELGSAPTIADLERHVTQEKQRPKFNPEWKNYPSMCSLWETVEECWDQDAEARLSAGCVTERISVLSRQPWSCQESPVTDLSATTATSQSLTPNRPAPNIFPVPSTTVLSIPVDPVYSPDHTLLPTDRCPVKTESESHLYNGCH